MPSPEDNDDNQCSLVAAPHARIELSKFVAGKHSESVAEAAVVSARPRRMTDGAPASRQDLVAALERIGRGDRASFELVYEATSLKLYGIVVRILRRRDLADEILQDVYVRVWQRAGDFDPASGSPITWLATIARNLALDEAKRKTAASIEDFPEVLQRPSGDDPSANQERNEELRRLNACLDGLGREKKEIVLLAYHYGMTREDISNRFGRPVATVKTWLRRSLAQLKDCLGQ
jgi:RNA polymerase sigma-70 factor (ECF subfamily)